MWWIWIVLSVCMGIWAIKDARLRKNRLVIPVISIFLAPITLPVYFATRNLKDREVRQGGLAWNILRNFGVFWTLICFVWVNQWVIIALVTIGTTKSKISVEQIDTLMGAKEFGVMTILFLWISGTVLAILLGMILKNDDIVERGPTGELAHKSCPGIE